MYSTHSYRYAGTCKFKSWNLEKRNGFIVKHVLSFHYRYVSLSDNEKTGYKARELKSVHVDAIGLYLKLNIHKNHINKYNIYNQVRVLSSATQHVQCVPGIISQFITCITSNSFIFYFFCNLRAMGFTCIIQKIIFFYIAYFILHKTCSVNIKKLKQLIL